MYAKTSSLCSSHRGWQISDANKIIRTPNLDQLAINCFVTTSICPTSRVSILTCKHKIGIFNLKLISPYGTSHRRIFSDNEITVLGFIGKWGIVVIYRYKNFSSNNLTVLLVVSFFGLQFIDHFTNDAIQDGRDLYAET